MKKKNFFFKGISLDNLFKIIQVIKFSKKNPNSAFGGVLDSKNLGQIHTIWGKYTRLGGEFKTHLGEKTLNLGHKHIGPILTPRSLNFSTHFISMLLNVKDRGIFMRLFVTTIEKDFVQFISNLL